VSLTYTKEKFANVSAVVIDTEYARITGKGTANLAPMTLIRV
jgi:hypothetical protein